MKQITLSVPNKIGVLAKICETLGGAGVNIKSIMAEGSEEKGVIRLITSDPETALNALKKNRYEAIKEDVLTISLSDKPGELGKIVRKLAKAKININYIYQLDRYEGTVELVLKVDRTTDAKKILGKKSEKFRV